MTKNQFCQKNRSRPENPRVVGSIPSLATTTLRKTYALHLMVVTSDDTKCHYQICNAGVYETDL